MGKRGPDKDADDTLGLFIRILEKDGGGNRNIVRVIIQKLAADQGPARLWDLPGRRCPVPRLERADRAQ